MEEITDNLGGGAPAAADDGLETRTFRVMAISVVGAVSLAAWLAPWRVTTGLLLGGALSLMNYHWMRTSIAALIQGRAAGENISSNGARYIVRYFVVAGAVIAAYKLNVVSLPATIVGLCSFVIALFAEACRQFYFTIVNREGIN